VGVLVLNQNGAHFLDACFRSLLENTFSSFDICLIDNNSSDDSVEFTRNRYPMVRVIENESNLGFAGAYDRAIRSLCYEYVVLLNNDTMVDTRWLEALVRVMERDHRIAACGSKIVMMWDKGLIDHAGGMLTSIGSGLDLGKWDRDKGQYDKTREIGFGCGCSLLLRRQAYIHVGGFDPDYIIYHEDVDLCWKFHLFGYSVMYVHDSIVYHHLGGGNVQSIENPWKVYLCQKNRLSNMIKNMGPQKLVLSLFISVCYDAVRTLRYLLLGRLDLVKMLVKGYAETFRRRGDLLRRRRFVQRNREVSDKGMEVFFHPLVPSALSYLGVLQMGNK
jgi:GT2 family glycosyltransferase